jgi:DNA-directed RNA polymerase specialized sigma24 family protein
MKQHVPAGAFAAQLGAEQQYRSLLLTFPHFSEEQEHALIERALAGEQVRNDLIVSLQPHIYNLAYRLASRYLFGKEQATERMDLVQKANEEMLRMFAVALSKENPCSYLLTVARFTMIDCLKEIQASKARRGERDEALLDPPDGEDVSPFIEALPVEVRLVPSRDAGTPYGALYQAIGALPEKQRFVMLRHYGLGCAPEPLNSISRRLSPQSPRPANAHYHHKRALVVLERVLGPALLHLSRAAGGAQ